MPVALHRIVKALSAAVAVVPLACYAADDWPSYNKTPDAQRYSGLQEINAATVSGLKVRCTYDTGEMTSFQTGLIEVAGSLYGTTEKDTFALDPSTCVQKWRVHEEYQSAGNLKVNRGVAWADGRLFRGTQDGRVIAYAADSGRKLWETRIADPGAAETVPAAPIVWQSLVIVGNAGGDNKGVKGRMYALDAATGTVRWETYLVPKDQAQARATGWGNASDVPVTGGATWTTYSIDPDSGLLYVPGGNPAPDFDRALRPGANANTSSIVVLDARTGKYRTHYEVSPGDFHDWDVSTAPVLLTTRSGRRIVAVAPKDGHLYAFDLGSGERRFRTPVTRIENADTPLSAQQPVHFCPGTQGGSEWNGAAFDPKTNLLYTGAVDWCTTVMLQPRAAILSTPLHKPWSGNQASSDKETFGKLDPTSSWAGWVYATDADSGVVAWRFKAPYPVMSGVTPTAGGLVFVGDMGGTLYALDASSGAVRWSSMTDGAVAGGVITYEDRGMQRLAAAIGMTSPIWPTRETTAKVVVLDLAR